MAGCLGNDALVNGHPVSSPGDRWLTRAIERVLFGRAIVCAYIKLNKKHVYVARCRRSCDALGHRMQDLGTVR